MKIIIINTTTITAYIKENNEQAAATEVANVWKVKKNQFYSNHCQIRI